MSVAPLLLPALGKADTQPGEPVAAQQRHRFQHDHILGTSFDLSVTGVSEPAAQAAERAALTTIERLRQILSTYDPASEISRLGVSGSAQRSAELEHVLAAYRAWNIRTRGALHSEIRGQINVDALGKAFIIDQAFEQARAAAQATVPHAVGLVLDIGGDLKLAGPSPVALGIADPSNPWDNATPLTHLQLSDQAVATSGSYTRGAHILDPRTGLPANGAAAATVVASDCVTANALATSLCILPTAEGLRLVEETAGAEALLIDRNGLQHRTSGFQQLERRAQVQPIYWSGWPNGYQVSVQLTLRTPAASGGGFGGGGGGFGGGRGRGGFGDRTRRPYVAVWAEDANSKVVRNIAVWASKPRYLQELRTWWQHNNGANSLYQMTRATRAPGEYNLQWNGMTDAGQPSAAGSYRIWVETAREHGGHYQESAMIECGGKPSSVTLRESPEFDAVKVEFGPAGTTA